MKLPKEITPCPIVEALVELRFIPKLPDEAVYGLLYNELKGYYSKFEKLPILQIPEEIRKNDPSFTFKPLYKMTSNNYSLSIGHRVVTLGCNKSYIGWEDFFKRLETTVETIKSIGLTDKILRVGIRYINFFDLNIFDKINLNISKEGNQFNPEQLNIRAEVRSGNYRNTLQISDRVEIVREGKVQSGSIIDIDTFIEHDDENNIYANLISLIKEGHQKEKELFFGLLKKDYLNSLDPKY
jgi:uncharacterized protein (TIGR04255 family)